MGFTINVEKFLLFNIFVIYLVRILWTQISQEQHLFKTKIFCNIIHLFLVCSAQIMGVNYVKL